MSPFTAPSTLRVLPCGLESDLIAVLKPMLPDYQWVIEDEVPTDPKICGPLFKVLRPDVVFLRSEIAARDAILAAARVAAIPVVVVARSEDTKEWLKVMVAGAADYIAPPFDQGQLRWIMQASVRQANG